jgi:hypothetical protein
MVTECGVPAVTGAVCFNGGESGKQNAERQHDFGQHGRSPRCAIAIPMIVFCLYGNQV